MTRTRLIYLLIFIVFAGLYIYDKGYFFFVMLITCIALVPLQLIISLPGMLRAHAAFTTASKEVRGMPPTASFCVNSRFTAGSVKGKLNIQNIFASTSKTKRIVAPYGQSITITAEDFGSICGAVSFSFKRLKVVDLLGIFAFPIKKPAPLVIFAMPPLATGNTLPALFTQAGAGQSLQVSMSQGVNSLREYVDIREYRPGDPVRDIHWKLTAKRDKVIVREVAFFSLPQPFVCFDFCGSPGDMAKTLSLVESASKELYALERAHILCWVQDDKLETRGVSSSADLTDVLYELLETPLPKNAKPVKNMLPHNLAASFMLATPKQVTLVQPKGVPK